MTSYNPWPRDNSIDLARYVNAEAKRWLRLNVNAHDLLGQANGRRQLVQAIYQGLQSRNIRYDIAEYHPSAAVQRIRTPQEILTSPGQGTCLDLAVLFCGICLGYGLMPVLIVLDGHAFAAISLSSGVDEWSKRNHPKTVEQYCMTNKSLLLKHLDPDNDGYIVVECTGFASSQRLGKSARADYPETIGRDTHGFLPFERAVLAGQEQLDLASRRLLFGIDIAAAKYVGRIEPYPIPEKSNEFARENGKALRDYLETFIDELQAEIAHTFTVTSQNTPSAVRQSETSRIRGKITLSPHQGKRLPVPVSSGSMPINAMDTEDRLFSSFSQAFHEQGRRILLLGTPGAGKTTTLLQFSVESARACLAALGRMVGGTSELPPIPVFCSVHRWDYKTPLAEWALRPVRNEFPGIDLEDAPVLYLFDGLDELGSERFIDPQDESLGKFDPRQSFLQAIEAQLPTTSVVVSCRVVDYGQLREKSSLKGAVTLLPLEPKQIQGFLSARNQWHLWELLFADNRLLELARTPLLLALLSEAVGTDQGELRWKTTVLTANSIFDLYISQRFAHEEVKRPLPFDEKTTRQKLGTLGEYSAQKHDASSITLYSEEIDVILGGVQKEFIDFVCSMHFMRRGASSRVQFLHLKFRDFCAVPALLSLLNDKDSYVRGITAEFLGEIGDSAAVSALITVLKDNDSSVRSKVAEALGKIGDSAAVSALITVLKGGNMRSNAAKALGKIGKPAIPSMLKLLKHDDDDWRESAVEALGEIGDPTTIPALLTILEDDEFYSSFAVLDALVKIGKPAIPSMLTLLLDDDDYMKELVLERLGTIGDATAIPALLSLLEDDGFRCVVPSVLGEIGDTIAVPTLQTLLKDKDRDMRYAAAEALGQMGIATAVPTLLACLKSTEYFGRQSAIEILGKLGDSSAVPVLITLLKDNDSRLRNSAAEALGKIGGATAVPALITLLKAEDWIVRRIATEALSEIGSATAIPALLMLLKETDSAVNKYDNMFPMQILGKIGKPAVPALITLLKDKSRYVSRDAAKFLGEIGDVTAVPALIALLKDEDSEMRHSAASALGEIGDVAAVPALLRLLKDNDSSIRNSAVMALGEIGDATAVPGLLPLLKDDEFAVKANAAMSLGQIGDAAAVPGLLPLLKDEDITIRSTAAEALGKIRESSASSSILRH